MKNALDSMEGCLRHLTREVVDEAAPVLFKQAAPFLVAEVRRQQAEESRAPRCLYVSVKKAAQMMDAHPSTVRKLIVAGKLGKHSVESELRVKVTDIEAYMSREGQLSPTLNFEEYALKLLGEQKPTNDNDD